MPQYRHYYPAQSQQACEHVHADILLRYSLGRNSDFAIWGMNLINGIGMKLQITAFKVQNVQISIENMEIMKTRVTLIPGDI